MSDAYQGLPGKRFRQETIDTESQRTGRLEGSIHEVLIPELLRSHGEKGRQKSLIRTDENRWMTRNTAEEMEIHGRSMRE